MKNNNYGILEDYIHDGISDVVKEDIRKWVKDVTHKEAVRVAKSILSTDNIEECIDKNIYND